jgi:DNA-binding FrmR family transcriptional regulator
VSAATKALETIALALLEDHLAHYVAADDRGIAFTDDDAVSRTPLN